MLEIKAIEKHFSGFSLGPVQLRIGKGEHYVLLGPSGSGKSLLLELIAGFQFPDKGEIILNGKDITHLQAHKRSMAFVFQKPALFPHLTNSENIAYSLHLQRINKKEVQKIVHQLSERFHIDHLLDDKPARLSGGEAQRVSLARALAMRPAFLLLDEPLSSLDVQLKKELRQYLIDLNLQGLTMLHVTHDFEEAIRFADVSSVIFEGKIIQSGKPSELYKTPVNSFVAEMAGHKNFFTGKLIPSKQDELRNADLGGVLIKLYSDSEAEGGIFVVDEHQIILQTEASVTSAQNTFKGVVQQVTYLQKGVEVELNIGIQLFTLITRDSAKRLNLVPGQEIFASFKASAVRFLEH